MSRKGTFIPQVAMLSPLNLKGQFDVFGGILQYARLHGPWRLYRMEGRPGEQKLLDLKRWGCTGIITDACSLEEVALLARTRLPLVVFEPSPEMRVAPHPLSRRSYVVFNSYMTGQQAARYFLERHYKHFAFVGETHDIYWSQERGQGFIDTIKTSSATCTLYPSLKTEEQLDWAVEQPRMQAWLQALPKPIALFAAMDGRARQVLDACMAENISVPDAIAVLGVDDDPFICEATFPNLSSIQTNSHQIGYNLAEHLDGLMHGKRLPKRVFSVTPTRIVTRRSTDATLIPDRQIARALEFIWREAGHQPIHVPDVVRLIGSSRRFAEIHFKTVVGRTIMEEIRRIKLERVCTLLSETNQSIGDITRQCGFVRESHLAVLFRKHFGRTMSDYRATSQSNLRT